MIVFRSLPLKGNMKNFQYAVINVLKKSQKRLGRIVWKNKYVFVPHPERNITKKQTAEIDAYIDVLTKQKEAANG